MRHLTQLHDLGALFRRQNAAMSCALVLAATRPIELRLTGVVGWGDHARTDGHRSAASVLGSKVKFGDVVSYIA